MAFSLRVSASFRFPLYGMHGVSATRPIGHESFFQASITGLRCVRIFRIGLGSVMNAMSRMSPPHPGHAKGNSSPTRAMSFAQAIREVSCDRGFA